MHVKPKNLFRRNFYFESKWLDEPELDNIVNKNWFKNSNDPFLVRLYNVAEGLNSWGCMVAQKFRDSIKKCKYEMEELISNRDSASIA